MTSRYVRLRTALVTAAVAAALAGCGAQSQTVEQTVDLAAADVSAQAVAADLRPLHAEAVELADLVLAAGPTAETAEVVRQVRAEQAELLAAAEQRLAGAAATPRELGELAGPEIEAVRTAVGEEAVRLGLDGLYRNHLAALTRAKAEVTRGAQGAGRELADRVLAVAGPRLLALPSS